MYTFASAKLQLFLEIRKKNRKKRVKYLHIQKKSTNFAPEMMTPKRIVFRAIVRSLEAITMMLPPRRTCNLQARPDGPRHVDLITIAFNNAELIRLQHRFVEKNFLDPHQQIIVDNSTKPEVRREIFDFCRENGLTYLGMPKNLLNKIGGSYSHAMTLNYTYRRLIRKRKPFAFGQIDHDLFPVKPVSILEKLASQPVYGPLRDRGNEWYLSAIMSFFRFDFLQDKKVDFLPVTPTNTYLDSGGGNWYEVYSCLTQKDLVFPNEQIVPLREGGDRHSDSLEYFDDKTWLHTINGSCWKKVQDGKDNLVRALLNSLLDSK